MLYPGFKMKLGNGKFFLWPIIETHPWRAVLIAFFGLLGVAKVVEDTLDSLGCGDPSTSRWLYLLIALFSINVFFCARLQARIVRGEAKRCEHCRSALKLDATYCRYCGTVCG